MTVRALLADWRSWVLHFVRATAAGSFIGSAIARFVRHDHRPSLLVTLVLLVETIVAHALLVREARRR